MLVNVEEVNIPVSSRGAIEEGKAIFHNIRNFVRFQLSTCVDVRFEARGSIVSVLLSQEYCRTQPDHAVDGVSLPQSIECNANPLDQHHHGWTPCSKVRCIVPRQQI